jgi:hypothetical protein
MSPATVAHRPATLIRTRRLLIIVILALSFTSMSCGSSQPDTEVRGVVEVKDTSSDDRVVDAKDTSSDDRVVDANDASSEVELIEPLCITNTPTHEPC